MKILISGSKIRARIRELALQICRDYAGEEELLVIAVLKGAAVFCSDIIREISDCKGPPIKLGFIDAKSYKGTKSTGKVSLGKCAMDVKGKNVLIVEDIIDTGLTISRIKDEFAVMGAKSVKVCSLLDKPGRRKIAIMADYCGFPIDDKFVVGYGLDYDEKYRELPFVAEIDED
jgi:hypoxanthine phosphoribosyltransferase